MALLRGGTSSSSRQQWASVCIDPVQGCIVSCRVPRLHVLICTSKSCGSAQWRACNSVDSFLDPVHISQLYKITVSTVVTRSFACHMPASQMMGMFQIGRRARSYLQTRTGRLWMLWSRTSGAGSCMCCHCQLFNQQGQSVVKARQLQVTGPMARTSWHLFRHT